MAFELDKERARRWRSTRKAPPPSPTDRHEQTQVRNGTLAGLDDQPDGGAFLTFDVDRSEFRETDHVDPVLQQVAAGDCDRLDGLVDGAGADGLNLRPPMLTHHPGNGTGDGRGSGTGRDLDDVHRASPLARGGYRPIPRPVRCIVQDSEGANQDPGRRRRRPACYSSRPWRRGPASSVEC